MPKSLSVAEVDDIVKAVAEWGDGFNNGLSDYKSAYEADVADIRNRLDAMDVERQRPGLGAGKTVQDKAFDAFLRGGKESLTDEYRNSLITADDTKGGYLVAPNQFEAGVLKQLTDLSPIRQLARVTTISTPEVSIVKQTSAPTAFWVGETEQRSETTESYGRIDTPVHTAAVYIDVSLEFLEDTAFDAVGEITADLATAFAKLESAAHIAGDGHKKPLGILNTPGISNVASGHATSITADALINTFYDLPEAYANNATWLGNRKTQGAVRKLKSGDGSYLWQDSIQAGTPAALLSRPFLGDQYFPDVGAGFRPIAFGDWNAAARIYDRIGLSIMRDDYTRAGTGEVRFWARRRTGFGIVRPEAIRTVYVAETV